MHIHHKMQKMISVLNTDNKERKLLSQTCPTSESLPIHGEKLNFTCKKVYSIDNKCIEIATENGYI